MFVFKVKFGREIKGVPGLALGPHAMLRVLFLMKTLKAWSKLRGLTLRWSSVLSEELVGRKFFRLIHTCIFGKI